LGYPPNLTEAVICLSKMDRQVLCLIKAYVPEISFKSTIDKMTFAL